MNKAVFLDRDGTINVEKHYLHKIEDFEFLPGVIDGLKLLQDAGFLLIIITNQSGIGRGYYTEEDFHKLNDWMLAELTTHGINIKQVYYCPHLPNASVEAYRKKCDCRKPALGMFENAIVEFDISIKDSWVVGDRIRDCLLCVKYACKGFLVEQDEYNNETLYKEYPDLKDKVCCSKSLLECSKLIIKSQKNNTE